MNQPRRPADPRRPEKVSKNDEANEIVELLRQVAHKIIALGDAMEGVKADYHTKCQQVISMEETFMLAERHEEEFEEWQELLLNLRSGVIDVGEALAGTVGRQ